MTRTPAFGVVAITPLVLAGAVAGAAPSFHAPAPAVHRNPAVWPNPSGFDPRRFLPGAPERHRYAWIPFGGGKRGCVGAAFARQEAVLLVVAVIVVVSTTVTFVAGAVAKRTVGGPVKPVPGRVTRVRC